MGFFDKFIPKEVKKVFKPVAKFSQKFIPKEIRPFLPMITPFLPAMGIMGQLGGPMGFAKMYGANLLSQQLADPGAEFDDLNQIAALLSGTQGGLTNTGTANRLRGMTTESQSTLDQIKNAMPGTPGADFATQQANIKDALANRSMLTKAKDLGLSGLAEASDYLTGTAETLQDFGSGDKNLFTGAGAKEFAKAAAVPFSTGMGGVTEAVQRPIMRKFLEDDAAERAEYETNIDDRNKEQADMTMLFMRQAGHDEQTIEDTLALDGLESYYSPPTESAAQGGIIGLKQGGIPDDEFMELVSKLRENGFSQQEAIEEAIRQLSENKANGGIIGLKEGGMLNFGGKEMDLRPGGFVPIGKKERADDVPARLSKNEFVMTADAVRAAGGGSVNKGAQRMYDVMNKLEARA